MQNTPNYETPHRMMCLRDDWKISRMSVRGTSVDSQRCWRQMGMNFVCISSSKWATSRAFANQRRSHLSLRWYWPSTKTRVVAGQCGPLGWDTTSRGSFRGVSLWKLQWNMLHYSFRIKHKRWAGRIIWGWNGVITISMKWKQLCL